MSNVVLDSSVVIALFRDERADVPLAPLVEGAYLSTVNLAEILSYLALEHPASLPRVPTFLQLLHSVLPFTTAQAQTAGTLRPLTKAAGLSLGDRACLALGIELDADVYTTDRAWKRVDVPCRIHLIR